MYITVIIPAFNESRKIGATIDSIKEIGLIDNIIVVDDGSTDNTADIAEKKGATVIKLDENRGKGNALNVGLENSRYDKSDIVVFLDADVGGSGSEIVKIINPIINEKCDVAIAKFKDGVKPGGFGLVKLSARFGAKLLTGVYVHSILSGQRAFAADTLEKLIVEKGYGAEVGMTIDLIRRGFTIKEYEVSMTHNETGRDLKGFLHRGKQLVHILKILLKKAVIRKA